MYVTDRSHVWGGTAAAFVGAALTAKVSAAGMRTIARCMRDTHTGSAQFFVQQVFSRHNWSFSAVFGGTISLFAFAVMQAVEGLNEVSRAALAGYGQPRLI